MADTTTPAGSSTYSSDTMYVGDGTWISSKNTFLLPNLQGLNFATMQYNSMSNRFASLPEYHKLIIGHGVIAAIVFLFTVPSAIFVAKFYFRNPRLALRLHIWLQILTVGLLTVVFILGWMAVGPERSLTNPHHGIGVAIYTLVLVQALGGGLIHHFEKGKARWRLPLKLMLHQWMGRAIALLGIAQIPLGMTLYGSPRYLFILYAVVVFAWLLLYFILTYINRPVIGDDGYGTESYVSGPTRTEITEDRRTGRSNNHAVRNTALFGAGLAGLSAFRRRSRSRSRRRDDQVTDISRTNRTDVSPSRRSRTNRTDVSPSRRGSRHSVAYTEDEKYSSHNRPPKNNTWRNRLLGAGAGLGAYAGFKRLFGRSKARDEESNVSSYRAPSGSYIPNRADVERVQQGEAPMSPGDSRVSRPNITAAAMASPTRQPLRPRRSRESLSSDGSDSYESDFEQHHNNGGHVVRNGVATLGVLGFFKEKQRQRREKKEQRRVDEMRRREQENADNINRANSHRYTDRPYNAGRRRPSRAETLASEDYGVTGSNPELSRISRPESNNLPLPASAAAMPLPGPDNVHHDSSTAYLGYNPDTGVGPAPNTHQHAPATTAYPVSPGAVIMPSGAVEPDPSRLVQQPYQDSRTHLPQGVPIVAAAAAANPPYSPAQSSYRPRPQSQQGRRNSASHVGVGESPESVASPPVSVKVQMHKDGRHVTLRRLNEEEAAAERDARKQERRQRRRRAESLSSGVEDEGTRFRRNMGAGSATNVPIANVPRPPSSRADELNLPPATSAPPPVPHHSLSPQGPGMHPSHIASSGMTSGIGSGGYDTGTGTDLDAFNENRRRRRAERAAAKQQRAAQSGQGARVEFS